MLKQVFKIEQNIGNKVYHFFCDQDSPLEHIKEALFQSMKLIGQIEDQIKASQVAPPSISRPVQEEKKDDRPAS